MLTPLSICRIQIYPSSNKNFINFTDILHKFIDFVNFDGLRIFYYENQDPSLTDSVFKFLAFLQVAVAQLDRAQLDGMLHDLLVAAHYLSTISSH
jgi:hypothetical protein